MLCLGELRSPKAPLCLKPDGFIPTSFIKEGSKLKGKGS